MTDETSANIGVLFVHGIGSQQPGATLRGFGGPLIESVGRWLGEGNVERTAPSRPSDGPEHERLRIADGDREIEVLAAESCWADTVRRPSYFALLAWLCTAVPFLVTRGLDTGLRRTNRTIDKQLTRPDDRAARPRSALGAVRILGLTAVRLLQNVVVVVVSLASLVLLFVFGAFGLSWWLRRLPGIVVSYVGDSYALLRDDGSAAAMTERVRRDLSWLQKRVGPAPVVVVAHSQGAEVVRRVLSRRDAPPVAALVTFGSGIEKLDAVDRLRHSLGRSLLAFATRIGSVAALALAVVAAVDGRPWWWIVVLGAIAFASLTAARALLRSIVGAEYDATRLGVGPSQVTRWTDLYATSDPVSEGALPLGSLGSSREIVNRRLIFTDHTSYWQNVEAFRAAVAVEIARAVRWWDEIAEPARIVEAATERARRVWWLVGARWIAVAGAVTVWLALGRGALAGVGLAAGALVVAFAAEVAWRKWSNRYTDAEYRERAARQLTTV